MQSARQSKKKWNSSVLLEKHSNKICSKNPRGICPGIFHTQKPEKKKRTGCFTIFCEMSGPFKYRYKIFIRYRFS